MKYRFDYFIKVLHTIPIRLKHGTAYVVKGKIIEKFYLGASNSLPVEGCL